MVAEETSSPPRLPPVYFAVGPYPHEVSCPYCKKYGKTIRDRPCLAGCEIRQYCSSCGEYLGTYKRPKM